MSNFITPEMDSVGKYRFKAPFDTLGNEQTEFTCMSIRRLADILADGTNVYKTFYEPYKISETDYRADVAAGVAIVGLQSAVGSWLHIPNSYLASYPDVSGVRYAIVALASDLGAMPETYDLRSLINEINDLIFARIGVRANTVPVINSQMALVPYDDHEKIEQVRKNNTNSEPPLLVQKQMLEQDRAILQVQVTALSNFIQERGITP